MKRTETKFVKYDEIGEPVICESNEYINYLLGIIRNTPNDTDLGRKLRNEYTMLKMALIMLLDRDLDSEIPVK